jgi:phytoene/squalene synthetase
MQQAGSENFPVALWLLGAATRNHLLALYGFARLVDDVGDEVDGDRLALLDEIERQLDHPEHPVMWKLDGTVIARRLPREPLLRLIEANRRDQVVTRYDTYEQLREYCQLSAAPVGELVLQIVGAATPERIALSDDVCAALQLIEHLQDVEEDASRGRVYIGPFDAIGHAAELLDSGPPLVRDLSGRAKLAVAGFLAGGRIALAGLKQPDRPAPSFAREFVNAVRGR